MKDKNLLVEVAKMLQTRLYEEFYICYKGIVLNEIYRITEKGLQMYISNFDGNGGRFVSCDRWKACENNILEKILIGEAYIYGYVGRR